MRGLGRCGRRGKKVRGGSGRGNGGWVHRREGERIRRLRKRKEDCRVRERRTVGCQVSGWYGRREDRVRRRTGKGNGGRVCRRERKDEKDKRKDY